MPGGRVMKWGWLMCLVTSLGAEPVQAGGGFVERFQIDPSAHWEVANYRFSHPHFDTDWASSQFSWANGAQLRLTPKTTGPNNFEGASIRRKTRTHYGRYETVMQPARGAGVVTGFFTYTGTYYGTRHDEIDIEFLGRDTTKMHAAWFVDGQLTNKFIDLGFDAADRPRRYAFDWLPGRLRWYAEGVLVFEVTSNQTTVPTVPGYLFANIWAADHSLEKWSGITQPDTKAGAYIGSVSFTPMAELESDPRRSIPAQTVLLDRSALSETTEPVAHQWLE